MYSKILVPLDGSPVAEAILPHVCTLAACTGAEIVLLQVTDAPVYHFVLTDPQCGSTEQGHLETEATAYLDAVAEDLERMGFRATTLFRDGEIAETIRNVAAEIHADIIAMCTHGRTGLPRMAFGSIAEAVLRGANLPMLVVRPGS